jgi:hypothetical protein
MEDNDTLEHLAQVAENTRKEIYDAWKYSWRRYGKLTPMARERIDMLKHKLAIVDALADQEMNKVRKKCPYLN